MYQKKNTDSECTKAMASGYVAPWKKLASVYHHMCSTRARSKGKFAGEEDSVTYLFMGLTAAAGKCINEAKKFYRGDTDASHYKLESSLASVRIYTEQLAAELRIDLDSVCEQHMQEVLDRVDGK